MTTNSIDVIKNEWHFDTPHNSTVYVIEMEEFIHMDPYIMDMFNAASAWGGPSIRSCWGGIVVVGWEFPND